MVRRRHAATAFRPSAPAGASSAPSRRQTAALLAGVLVVAGGIAVASFAVKPSTARSFDLYYGSVYINDNFSPVAIDLSSGKATVRLSGAGSAVTAATSDKVDVVPLVGGTLMFDPDTGEFNMLDASGFVVKPEGGGVNLPVGIGTTLAVASGDSAYLVRAGKTETSVYLVGQSTVASAIGVTSGVKPRAGTKLDRPTSTDAETNALASANGDLWLLTGPADGPLRITQLSVPAGSNAGAQLEARRRATVGGISAVESSTENPDGSGADVVGVASPDRIRVFDAQGRAHPTSVDVPADVLGIQAVRQARGKLVYVYRTASSYYLVQTAFDAVRASVSAIAGLSQANKLLTPSASEGKVFTIVDDSQTAPKPKGTLLQINSDGTAAAVAGFDGYPVPATDRLDLTRAAVTAVGSRVIFNAPVARSAVVFFADGSHPTRVVDKQSAVQVNTSGDAAITGTKHTKPRTPKPGGSTPKHDPHPEQAVNNRITCRGVSQKPHIPVAHTSNPASRSIQLDWTYPVLDPQDCIPSTYTIAVHADDQDAPDPAQPAPVNGTTSVTLTRLFPDTTYSFVVTAHIRGQSTASAAVSGTTSIEGPPAPTNLRTSVDSLGNWTISWNSCGGLTRNCVPTDDWQIIPRFCDGVGLSSPPDTRRRVGDPSQHSFSYTYTGDEGLLGRGLSFDVQGVGEKGTFGDTAVGRSCQYSWTPVVARDISISASAPPITTTQTTSYTDVRVNFAGGQTHDLGGVGGEMTYYLLQGGEVVTKAGPTMKSTMRLDGVAPGVLYDVAVSVNPARHRDRSERIGPKAVRPAIAKWPQISVATVFQETSAYRGNLYVTVTMPPGTKTRNETFDLTPSSQLRCANAVMYLDQSDLRLGQRMSFDIDRTKLNGHGGTCQVFVGLQQNPRTVTDPPLYGDGTTSSGARAAVSIDTPRITATNSDFTAAWSSDAPTAEPAVVVRYSGGDPLFLTYAQNWNIFVTNDGGQKNCGAASDGLTVTNPSAVISVDKPCIRSGGNFTVQISLGFFGERHTFQFSVNGTAPEPVDPGRMAFRASFTNPILGASEVRLEYDGDYDQSVLDDLDWSYSVASSLTPGIDCLQGNDDPTPNENGGPTLPMSRNKCPKDDGNGNVAVYTLSVHFHDRTYGVKGDYTDIPIDGVRN